MNFKLELFYLNPNQSLESLLLIKKKDSKL